MSLDLFLTATPNVESAWGLEPRLALEDSGVLRCIQQFTAGVVSASGGSFDTYGSNVFEGASLPALQSALARAFEHFASLPETFEVWVGTELKPHKVELFAPVSRQQVLAAITSLQALVAEAISQRMHLALIGD